MRVPSRDYTLSSFYDMLLSHPRDYARLKILYYNTYFGSLAHQDRLFVLDEIFKRNGFRSNRMGDVKELVTSYRDPETKALVVVKYYAHLSAEDQVLMFFTDASSDLIEKTLGLISDESGLFYMWISPWAFEHIKNEFLSEYPHAKITHFSATKRSPIGPRGKIRPDFGRTVVYYGDDGKEALEEYEYYYGVVPRIIRFHVPGITDMEVSAQGVFTYRGGKLDFFFNFCKEAVIKALEVRRVLERSKFATVSVKTARKELSIPYVVPWIVDFSQPLDSTGCKALMKDLSRNQFAVYNHTIIEGSLRFDATVVDETKKNIFEISATEKRMLISPRHEINFDSFLRFLATIVENFDPSAICREVQGGGEISF